MNTIFKTFIIQILIAVFALGSSPCMARLKVGDVAPNIVIANQRGEMIELSKLRGQVVLIDFWASWCLPCRMANEEVVPLYQKYASLGFEIFSVSLDIKKEAWIKAIQQDKLSWENHGCDYKVWEGKAALTYNIESVPSTFLLDEKGVIVAMDLDEFQLEKKLHDLLFKGIQAFPLVATEKVLINNKAKFEVKTEQGTTVLKGRAEFVDIKSLSNGNYVLYVNEQPFQLHKIATSTPFISFTPARVTDKIMLSKRAKYEVYNLAGKKLLSGEASELACKHLKEGSYYIVIDGTIHSFYKE